MEKFIAVITSEKFYLPFVYVAIGLVLNMVIGNVVDKLVLDIKVLVVKIKEKILLLIWLKVLVSI